MQSLTDIFGTASLVEATEVLIKLIVGLLLAGAIGWEREKHGRAAGLRTHMLVMVGVILFSEVSKAMALNADPTRIAAQIVTGIGFLGAGTILRTGTGIRGLTTAASIWATAGIGMAVSAGRGLILVAVVATALSLFTLALVDDVERRFATKGDDRELLVTLKEQASLAALLEALARAEIEPRSLRLVHSEPDLQVALRLPGDSKHVTWLVLEMPMVKEARWSD